MSSAALDQPPFLYAQPGDAPAPLSYEIATRGAIQPTASTATFDGTGAGGPFLACLSFYAQSGELLSRVFPQTVVAAGDVAQVSYAPFPGGLASNAIGDGIQFDKDNVGDWLRVTTSGQDPATGASVSYLGAPFGIDLRSEDSSGSGDSFFQALVSGDNNSGVLLEASGDNNSGIKLQVNGAGTNRINLLTPSGAGIDLTNNGGSTGINLSDTSSSGIALAENGTGGISVADGGGTGSALTSNGPVNVLAGTDATVRSGGTAFIEGGTGVDVLDLASGGVRIQSVNGQISILTAVGQHGILLGGGYPIILNADTNGATNNTTIQMRLDGSTNSFAVINLAASAVYFAVRSDGRVAMPLLPTSSAGLGAGDLWRSGNDVKIV